MPVPSSGQLRLRADINQEVNGNDTDNNVSLGTLADEAGFDTPPDQMSEFYSYTACVAPSVTTNSASSNSYTSFYANGNMTSLGGDGCTNTDRGFYMGTSSNYASNTKYSIGSSQSTGAFSRSFTGLNDNTTYYFTAYATNAIGETRGSTVSNTTLQAATYQFNQVGTTTFNGPDRISYQGCVGNASTSANGGAYYQYNHASYGWTNYSSAYRSLSGTKCGQSDPGGVSWSNCAPRRTDASTNTDVRSRMTAYINGNNTWTGYYNLCEISPQPGYPNPSSGPCNPGRQTSYSRSVSTCSWRGRYGNIMASCWGPTNNIYGDHWIEYTDTANNTGGSFAWHVTMTNFC